jgi:hypothetical protein
MYHCRRRLSPCRSIPLPSTVCTRPAPASPGTWLTCIACISPWSTTRIMQGFAFDRHARAEIGRASDLLEPYLAASSAFLENRHAASQPACRSYAAPVAAGNAEDTVGHVEFRRACSSRLSALLCRVGRGAAGLDGCTRLVLRQGSCIATSQSRLSRARAVLASLRSTRSILPGHPTVARMHEVHSVLSECNFRLEPPHRM